MVSLFCKGQILVDDSSNSSSPKFPIRTIIGNDLSGIHSDVDLKDIQTAWEVWQDELQDELEGTPRIALQHRFYADLQDMIDDFNNGMLDMIDTTSLNYLRMKPAIEHSMAPGLYGVVRDGKKTHRYLLLVRSDSNFSRPEDLHNITILMKKQDTTGRFYLNSFLKRHEMHPAKSFFFQIHEVKSYSQAVLGVFFKQAQACITTESVLRVMEELNPQLGKQLKALHVSPELMNSVFFFHKAYHPKAREFLLEEALNMELTEYGRQILMLYKIDRVVQLDESEFERHYELLEDDDFLHSEEYLERLQRFLVHERRGTIKE